MSPNSGQPDYPNHTVAYRKEMIQRRFLTSISAVMVVLATIGLFFSLLRIPHTGLHFNHLVHMALALVILVMFFLRKRLSNRALVVYILAVFAVLSISSLLQYGLVSAGLYFASICMFVAGVTLGLRGGILAALFFAALEAVIAYLWMSGQLVFPGDVGQYILLPSVWITMGGAFFIITAVFYISASGFVHSLRELVDTIDRQKQEIQARTTELGLANRKLKEAMGKIKTLDGLLPICANCKKIRDDKGYWQQVEQYVRNHTQAEFTHGLCPDCTQKLYPEIADRIKARREKDDA